MNESVLITRIVYFFYLIFIGIFGIIIGFIFGTYNRQDDIQNYINRVFLLLLFLFIYNNRFNDGLSLETRTAETFSKFSLKTIEQIDPSPLKITLKESEQISLPFLIIEDPFIFIYTEILCDESTNYHVELFKFSQDVNQKIKY